VEEINKQHRDLAKVLDVTRVAELRRVGHQQAVAEAIFSGVREHFRTSPPDGSLFARQRDSRRGATPIIAGSATP